jgi:hypothetical protein
MAPAPAPAPDGDATAGDAAIDRRDALAVLAHPHAHPWKVQGIGLLSLRLDGRRERRLHVWDPATAPQHPPVHDHPYDFTSTVIAGELTDTTWVEHPEGEVFRRERYRLDAEDDRTVDEVRLVATPRVLLPGESYRHAASDLHDSRQGPGTVTVIRCTWHDPTELSVCFRPGDPWVSAGSRPATPDEIQRITTPARELLAQLLP